MSKNKYCTSCGAEIKTNTKYCYNCGSELVKKTDESNPNANKLGAISLILTFCSYPIVSFLTILLPSFLKTYVSSLIGIGPLAGIVVMIIGRIKYPSNKFLKIIMWIYIIDIIVSLILFVLLVIWCAYMCKGLMDCFTEGLPLQGGGCD